MSKNNKGTKSSRNSSTNKRKLPKYISYNTGNSYRVRKTTNGQLFDKTFPKLKDAKAIVKALV